MSSGAAYPTTTETSTGSPGAAHRVARLRQVCQSSNLSADVMGLVHRKEYMFRVKAVNNIGESEPLKTDRSIIAKNECGTSPADRGGAGWVRCVGG